MKRVQMVLAVVMVWSIGVMACHHDEASKKEVQQVAEKSCPEIKQKTCPVTGDKINKDFYVEQDGKKVYVCCKDCIDVVEKDFEKYLGIVEEGKEGCEAKESEANINKPSQDRCYANR